MKFSELQLNANVLEALDAMRFDECTPIQEQAIPIILEGKDLIAVAQTGTGKTAAYGLPLLQKIDVASKHTQAIILSPTRELCLQIADDLKDFAKYIKNLHVEPVYGGASIVTQIHALKHGAQIIVATPGRLIDLMNRGVAKLDQVNNGVSRKTQLHPSLSCT